MRSTPTFGLMLGTALLGFAYTHVPPTTLKRVCKEASWIRVLIVKAHDQEKRVVAFELSETVQDNPKWKSGVVSFRLLVPADAPGSQSVLDLLEVGKSVSVR